MLHPPLHRPPTAPPHRALARGWALWLLCVGIALCFVAGGAAACGVPVKAAAVAEAVSAPAEQPAASVESAQRAGADPTGHEADRPIDRNAADLPPDQPTDLAAHRPGGANRAPAWQLARRRLPAAARWRSCGLRRRKRPPRGA